MNAFQLSIKDLTESNLIFFDIHGVVLQLLRNPFSLYVVYLHFEKAFSRVAKLRAVLYVLYTKELLFVLTHPFIAKPLSLFKYCHRISLSSIPLLSVLLASASYSTRAFVPPFGCSVFH